MARKVVGRIVLECFEIADVRPIRKWRAFIEGHDSEELYSFGGDTPEEALKVYVDRMVAKAIEVFMPPATWP